MDFRGWISGINIAPLTHGWPPPNSGRPLRALERAKVLAVVSAPKGRWNGWDLFQLFLSKWSVDLKHQIFLIMRFTSIVILFAKCQDGSVWSTMWSVWHVSCFKIACFKFNCTWLLSWYNFCITTFTWFFVGFHALYVRLVWQKSNQPSKSTVSQRYQVTPGSPRAGANAGPPEQALGRSTGSTGCNTKRNELGHGNRTWNLWRFHHLISPI